MQVLLLILLFLGIVLLCVENYSLRKLYGPVEKIKRTLAQSKVHAKKILEDAENEACSIIENAMTEARSMHEKASHSIVAAEDRLAEAERISTKKVAAAEKTVSEIHKKVSGAEVTLNKVKQAIVAHQNIIQGYGEVYIIPFDELLDNLADEYSFSNAGRELKDARNNTRNLLRNKKASTCSWSGECGVASSVFVVDTFNCRVDAILSKIKVDNYGILKQKILDAYALINNQGIPLGDACITEDYLKSRLIELKCLSIVSGLKERDREEQRELRHQLKEEEKIRREQERVIWESEKQKEMLHQAMAVARKEYENASEEQKAAYNA